VAAPPRPDRADDSAPLVRNVRIDSGSDGQRLDNFLAKILKGVPRTHLYRVIRSGEVRVNKGRAAADTRLALGDEVRIPPMRVADRSERPKRRGASSPVVHEDEAIVCIDKPAGVAVHGGSGESFGVIEQMRRARPDEFLELVHRLDKETSGLLLVAKTRPALVKLQNDLRSRAPGGRSARPMRLSSSGPGPSRSR
jgi:23S rRNA pseudouridine955/2504/2580 synthase